MPTIHHEMDITAPVASVWEAVRDVGALHTRLVPGFVVATEMLAGKPVPTRRVTFASGVVLDEVIVSVDDDRRRLVWAIQGVDHHNGAMQVFEHEDFTRVTWTADILPQELSEQFSPLMARGLEVMKDTLEARH